MHGIQGASARGFPGWATISQAPGPVWKNWAQIGNQNTRSRAVWKTRLAIAGRFSCSKWEDLSTEHNAQKEVLCP
jgi:hypothetical protein